MGYNSRIVIERKAYRSPLYSLTQESKETFRTKQEEPWRDEMPLANALARNNSTS